MIKLSIIIKALNEEANIARAVESALVAAARHQGEVVLADCQSTDRTVEIARRYPIRIVQLANASERCCGVAPQLGLQHCRGAFIYILDGDMELKPDFIDTAMAMLDADPGLAGVGGYIAEMRTTSIQFKGRARKLAQRRLSAPVATQGLSGGGLYRRAALDDVGYMSDRNLHGNEEFDLGVRLGQKSWRLIAIPDHAADHYSYEIGTLALIWHRIRTRALLGQGELLRAAVDNQYLGDALRIVAVRISVAVTLFWATVAIVATLAPEPRLVALAALTALVALFAILTWRHGSAASALHSIVVWHLVAAGLLLGLLRRRRPPRELIASKVLHDAVADPAAPSLER